MQTLLLLLAFASGPITIPLPEFSATLLYRAGSQSAPVIAKFRDMHYEIDKGMVVTFRATIGADKRVTAWEAVGVAALP